MSDDIALNVVARAMTAPKVDPDTYTPDAVDDAINAFDHAYHEMAAACAAADAPFDAVWRAYCAIQSISDTDAFDTVMGLYATDQPRGGGR